MNRKKNFKKLVIYGDIQNRNKPKRFLNRLYNE